MLSEPEGQVLMLLDSAGTTLTGCGSGRVRWALDAADVVCMLELGAELAGVQLDPATSDRLARLLGAEFEP